MHDLGVALERVGERMACDVDSGDQHQAAIEELGDGAAKRLGSELHLPQFVDHHDLFLPDADERGQRDALEGLEVDAVAPDAWRAGERHVCKRRALPFEGLHGKADPLPALAKLFGDETAKRDAALAQQLGQPNRDRRLTDAGPPLEQDAGRVGYRFGSSGPPGPRCSGVSVR